MAQPQDGEHPIVDGSASILTGRIYDDRGNRMSPTHSNKLGVRYRYYVSRLAV